MAMKKKQFVQSEFVNYVLSKSNQNALRKFAKEGFGAKDWLTEVNNDGYKITFSPDRNGHGFACWLIPLDADGVNHGLILSGRGGTPTNAFVECVYKHSILFAGKWPRPTDDGQSWTWDADVSDDD